MFKDRYFTKDLNSCLNILNFWPLAKNLKMIRLAEYILNFIPLRV